MSNNISLGKLIAGISLIGILTYLMMYSFLKSFNEIVDKVANESLDFLSTFGFNLNLQEFWFILGFIFLLLIAIVISKSD